MQLRRRLAVPAFPQPVALNRVETRMLLQAILPGAVEQVMLQELAVARIEVAAEQRLAGVDRLCQRRRRGGIDRQRLPQARGEIAFDKPRAAAQARRSQWIRHRRWSSTLPPQLVAMVGIDGDLQVMETLDFTGHPRLYLAGLSGATPLIRLRVSSCNSGSGVTASAADGSAVVVRELGHGRGVQAHYHLPA